MAGFSIAAGNTWGGASAVYWARCGAAFFRSGKLHKGRRGVGEARFRGEGKPIKGRPFIKKAFEEKGQEAVNVIIAKLRESLAKYKTQQGEANSEK